MKTYVQVEENGIGLILIQNGPYIQITGLVDNSAAAKNERLQPGQDTAQNPQPRSISAFATLQISSKISWDLLLTLFGELVFRG